MSTDIPKFRDALIALCKRFNIEYPEEVATAMLEAHLRKAEAGKIFTMKLHDYMRRMAEGESNG